MGKHYEVFYWAYNEDDGTSCTEKRMDVAIPEATMTALITGSKTLMYHFIIEDGLDWFIPPSQVCEIRQMISYEG